MGESTYAKMMRKVGSEKSNWCKKCGDTTNWTFKHSSEVAGTGLLGNRWHYFGWSCDNKCGNYDLIHREQRDKHGEPIG